MPNTTVPAAGEAMPKIECAEVPRSHLIDIMDKLIEARDSCEAIFMAAASLSDPGEIAVFQRLSQVVTDRAREATGSAEVLVEACA